MRRNCPVFYFSIFSRYYPNPHIKKNSENAAQAEPPTNGKNVKILSHNLVKLAGNHMSYSNYFHKLLGVFHML